MTNRKWLAAAAVATVLAGGLATAALAGDGSSSGGGQPSGQPAARGGWRMKLRQLIQRRRARALGFLASLQFTDAQRQMMLDKARAAAPIVEGAKADARKVVAQAWAQASQSGGKIDRAALRAQVRDQVKAIREKAWTQLEPLAKDVVATLTPEQRQKFQDAATKHGRTLDDAKLAKFMGRLITRPMAVPYLEARLAK